MEDELKEITKTLILQDLSKHFKKCKHYVFFIDNDVLRICSEKGEFKYQKVYVNPITQLMYANNYVADVVDDYKKSFIRWIIAQFRGI